MLGETDPVLLVLEDAHWIDATTLEFMTRIADSIAQARLLVCGARGRISRRPGRRGRMRRC